MEFFSTAYAWFETQVKTNEIFAGVVGGSVMVSALYYLKYIPSLIGRFLVRQFTVTMEIRNNNEAYAWISIWLSQHPYLTRARRVRMLKYNFEGEDGDRKEDRSILGIGEGWHLIREGLGWIAIQRIVEEGQSLDKHIKETYELYSIGRSQDTLKRVVSKARELMYTRPSLSVRVYDYGWREVQSKEFRDLSSVIMEDSAREDLVGDIQRFFDSKDRYVERGIPWHRGYLLYGPAGCGKTSLIMALASHFRRPLCVMNVGSLDDDSDLLGAIRTLPKDGFLVLEDIDSIQNDRATTKKSDDSDEDRKPISMSALLNCIDGPFSGDGQIILMTTNYPEKLDAALLRAGRIDYKLCMDTLTTELAQQFFRRFFPNTMERVTVSDIRPCVMQEICMTHENSAQEACKAVNTLKKEGDLCQITTLKERI